jgi:chemotaxis protein histidine kinase CheA
VEQLVHLRLKSIYKAFKQSSATSSNSSSASFAVKHNDQDGLKGTSNKKSKEDIAVQVHKEGSGSVLQVAAAAAAAASALQTSANGSISAGKSNLPLTNEKGELNLPHGMNPARMGLTNSLFPPSSQKATKKNESDKFAAKTTAEADAAAAALLAELEEEMQNAEATTSAKKSKKKKKKEKERQLAKEKEDMAKKEAERKEAEKKETQKRAEEEKKKAAILAAEGDTKTQTNTTPVAKNDKNKKKEKSSDKSMEQATSLQVITESPNDSDDDDSSHLAKSNMADLKEQDNLDDDTEMRLALAISANDLEGIESILLEMKGVPGRAALRKNAKKAVKKIKEEQEAAEAEQRVKDEKELAKSLHSALGDGTGNNSGVQYKPTDPLITTVSSTHRVQSSAGPARYERVMSMAPSVVGWVIGKGGQRIRDLMEESGAKVWIDQESMGPNDRRIVYVSGSKKSVETAVRTIKDLVNTAPTGSTTNPGSATVTTVASTGGVPNNLTVPEFEDIVSTRSSLTSTPISMANSSQHATMSSQKQFLSSPRRDLLHPPDNSTFLPSLNLPSAATPSSSHPRSISAPPGISSFLNQSSELHKVGEIRKNIVCEKRFVPLLIGRRGWTVKHIQDTSGARVDIDQNVNPPLIILSGAFEEVREAERQVQEILNYPHAQSNYGESGADNDVDIEPLSRNCLNADPFKPNTRSPGEQESHLHNLRVAKTSDASPGFYNEGGFLKSHPTISQTVPQFDYTRGSSNASTLFDNTPLNPHSQHLQNNSFSLFDSNSPSLNRTTTGSAFGSLTPSSINHEHTFSRHPTSTMPPLQGSSQVTMNQYSEQHLPMHNFEYNDTILPLNANRSSHPSQYSGMTHNVSNSFIENDTMRTHPPGRQDQHEVFDDYNVVNNLFGSSLMDSQQSRNNESQNLLPSFNDLSLGNTGNSLTFDWDLLANATLEDGTPPRRSVGLGGVRLDNSHDFAGNNGK